LCTHTHAKIMRTKTISIKKEAYEALLREKKNRESFTETILRITKKSGKLSDCFGTWKMTDEEEKIILNDLSQGWRWTQRDLQ
jgi:predicted CopG family antitoxin